MSTWGKVILTKQGEALLNQCLGMSGHYNLNQSNDPDSDTKGIVITRVSTGRYRYTNTSVEYLKERTDLATSDGATGGTSGFVENLNITGLKPITSSNSDQYGQALIQVQLDNQREDRNIKEEYPLGQLGVFARLEGSTEEILFTIVQYAGDTLPVIPAPVTPTLLNFGFYIAIATTETISIEMEFTGIVTAKQFDDYKLVTDETLNTLNEHTKNTENPHKVTAQQVGLGNVPNVTTDNQTPTFTQSSTLSEINSGEKLSTLFGKIKKAIVDLISHLANTSNPHSVTKSQVGLGNVDDTSDADKPISTATKTALDGKAPKTHASSSEDYGIGDREVYGHLKLFNGINSTADTRSGFAATPNAVKTAYEKAVEGVNAAEKAQETANSKLDKGFISNGYTGIDEVTARLNGIEEGAEVNKVTSVQGRTGDVTVTKADIDLGNVPNVTTNNQTPTFTTASSRTNINSGETLATIFGKIKKWFSDLKTIAFTGSYTDLLNKPTSLKNPYYLELYLNGGTVRYDGSMAAGETWYAPTSVGTAGYNLISNGSGAPVWQQPPYAVCSSSSGTRAKTVSITNFKLVTGTRVSVKFSNKTSTTPILNVSSTGAKEIKLVQTNGTYVSVNSYNSWSAGEIVELIYDGTYWVAVSSNMCFVSGAQSATVIVGTTYSSGYCDYRCDGSNDVSMITAAIQEAYRRLSTNDSSYTSVAYPDFGVKVFFKAGVYKVNGNIYADNTSWVSNDIYITLEGESENAVTFVKTADSNHSLIDATDISFVFKNINFHFAQVTSTEIKCSGASFCDCNISLRTAGYSGDSFTFIVARNSDNGVVRMNGGSFTFITVSGWTPCIKGIDCYGVDIHNCNIRLANGANSNDVPSGDSLELNFIYQTQSTESRGTYPNVMSHCIFRCSGNTSIIASTEISITESEITLVNNSSKISHYATTSTQTLRNIFANNRVHLSSSYLYMRFGIISNCTFGRADTYGSVSSSYSYRLYNEVCCSITGNFFVGVWGLYLGSRNAIVTGNMYKGSLSKSSTSTGTVTMANNVAAN
jgi:hypothetical protein